MGFWIIIVVLAFIGSIIWAIIEADGDLFFIGVIFTLLIALIGAMVGGFIGMLFPSDAVFDTEEIPICAIADNSATSGGFFLGSGSLKDDMYYYYLTKNEDGTKEMHKVRSEGVKINDSEKENPRIVIEYKQNSNPVVRFFFFTYRTEHIIYIPPNSIKYNYNIDLE